MTTIPHHFNNSPFRGRGLQSHVHTALSARLGIFLNNSAKIAVLLILLPVISGCVSIMYYEGNYRGKVIDAETLQPIQGAVVLGVWSKGYHGAGGVAHEYYDARETTTDEHGEFTVNGMGPRAITHLKKMRIVIFKAGFEEIGLTEWDSLKTAIYYIDRVKWEGNKAIIPLDKLSLEKRRTRFNVSPTRVPNEKQARLLEEIKKEELQIR